MKSRPRAIVILSILVGYVLLQFIWWEILLVRQTVALTQEREKLAALSLPGTTELQNEIDRLRKRKTNQVLMIVGEGTVFLTSSSATYIFTSAGRLPRTSSGR